MITPPDLPSDPPAGSDPGLALIEQREVVFDGGAQFLSFYRGEALKPGNYIPGPALIVRSDTTILLGPSDQAQVDGYGNLVMDIGA